MNRFYFFLSLIIFLSQAQAFDCRDIYLDLIDALYFQESETINGQSQTFVLITYDTEENVLNFSYVESRWESPQEIKDYNIIGQESYITEGCFLHQVDGNKVYELNQIERGYVISRINLFRLQEYHANNPRYPRRNNIFTMVKGY